MKEKIIKIIQEECALDEEIFEDTKLEILSLDSLSFIEAMVKIENEFDIEFDFEQTDMSNWDKVNDIIEKARELCDEKNKE